MDRKQGETRELTVTLTPEELEERGADLAAAVRNADQEEQHLEGRKAAWREELKGLKEDLHTARAEASRLAEIVRTGKDKRDVSCTWKHALDAGWAFLVRNDTGECIQSRKLKDEERQLTIGEPPFAEPTPEELAEWLKSLPVNEPDALGEGHAGTLTAEERLVGALLDPEADESFGPSSEELTEPVPGFEKWAAEMAEDPNDLDDGDDQGEFEEDEDYDEGGEDTPIEEEDEEEVDAALDDATEPGEIVVPPLSLNPSLPELVAMSEEQAEALVRRSRAKR